jgi:hypothetical protein
MAAVVLVVNMSVHHRRTVLPFISREFILPTLPTIESLRTKKLPEKTILALYDTGLDANFCSTLEMPIII